MGEEPICYLDTTQAAALLGLSPRTLEHYRVAGGGPPFLTYCNRIHYLHADLGKRLSAPIFRSGLTTAEIIGGAA